MDLNDGVVDINHHRSARADPAKQIGVLGEVEQEPRSDGVGLAHVPEGELPKEGAQRRRGIGAVEDLAHRPVAQQCHIVNAVRAGGHARDQAGQLQPRVGALVGGYAQVFIAQLAQARLLGQGHQRDQTRARHEIRLIEPRRRR